MALLVHGGNVSTAFAETVGLFYNSETVRPQRTRRVTLLILFLTFLGLGAFTHAYGETVVSIHGGDFHINGKPTYAGREWRDQPMNNFIAAVSEHASWGYFDYRMKGEGFDEGYQSIPVNWTNSSDRKRGFYKLCEEITGSKP